MTKYITICRCVRITKKRNHKVKYKTNDQSIHDRLKSFSLNIFPITWFRSYRIEIETLKIILFPFLMVFNFCFFFFK